VEKYFTFQENPKVAADFSLLYYAKLIPFPLLSKREGEYKSLSLQERDIG